MASPLPTIVVTGRYVDVTNRPVEGHVTITPLHRVAGAGWVVVGAATTVYIRDGLLQAAIIADSDQLSGDLYVRITETICREEPVSYVVQPEGSTLDLSTAPRLDDPPPGQLYIPATALGQPHGVATLGPDGKLVDAQLPEVPTVGSLDDLADVDNPIGAPTGAVLVRGSDGIYRPELTSARRGDTVFFRDAPPPGVEGYAEDDVWIDLAASAYLVYRLEDI